MKEYFFALKLVFLFYLLCFSAGAGVTWGVRAAMGTIKIDNVYHSECLK